MATLALVGRFQQWAHRANEQTFTSIADLKAEARLRRDESLEWIGSPQDMQAWADSDDVLVVGVPSVNADQYLHLVPSHWAFTQLAQSAGAPSGYLRQLPAGLAARNLDWCLKNKSQSEKELQVLYRRGGDKHLDMRGLNSTTYARIWDEEVIEAVERVNQKGRWQIPAANFGVRQSNEAPTATTALSISDRDMYMFLVDPNTEFKVKDEILQRGFIVKNSEVGASSVRLTTFLYREYCDNRTIFGMTNEDEVRVRHFGYARDRFNNKWLEFLEDYANGSAHETAAVIKKALEFEAPVHTEKGWEGWLCNHGFTQGQAQDAIRIAECEEGQACSLWDIIQGLTASARELPHNDQRVELETRAGQLLRIFQE